MTNAAPSTTAADLTASLDATTQRDVQPTLTSCQQQLTTLTSSIQSQATTAVQQYSASGQSTFQQQMEAMKAQAIQSATATITSVYNNLETVGENHPAAQSAILTVGQGVEAFINNIVSAIANFFDNLVNEIVNAVENAYHAVINFFSGIASKVEAFF